MKHFEPSTDFVANTMKRVRNSQKAKLRSLFAYKLLSSDVLIRYALSLGGLCLGLFNLFRLYSTVFANVACH